MQFNNSVSDETNQSELALQDAPAARLNAEMFVADDIDGVTEGLIGSGNLNYLILQSQQTNETRITSDPFSANNADYGAANLPGFGPGGSLGDLEQFRGYNPSDFSSDDSVDASLLDTGTAASGDPAFGIDGGAGAGIVTTLSSFNSNGSSSIFNNNNISAGIDGSSGENGIGEAGLNGNTGNDGTDGNDGDDGVDGDDGTDGNDGGGNDPDDDFDLNIDVVSDIINLNLGGVLDPVENIIGDIDIDADAILGDILSPDDGILPNPAVILDALVGGTEILDDYQVDVILAPVEDIASSLIDSINPVLGDLLPFAPDPLGTVGDILDLFGNEGDTDLVVNLGMDLPDAFGLSALGGGSINIPLDPVEGIIGDVDITASADALIENLITTDISDAVVDLGLVTDGDMIPGMDVLVSSDDLADSVSGIVEDLSGENLSDLIPDAEDGLSTEPIFDSVTEAVDGILGGSSTTGGADSDLVIDTGVEALDVTVDNLDAGATWDTVENIAGDIDLDVNLDTDVVNDVMSGDTDAIIEETTEIISDIVDINLDPFNPEPDQNEGVTAEIDGNELTGGLLSGGESGVAWPEETVSDLLGSDLTSDTGLGDVTGDVLPEPEGIISEGMDMIEDVTGSSGGGLAGGLGGLFG